METNSDKDDGSGQEGIALLNPVQRQMMEYRLRQSQNSYKEPPAVEHMYLYSPPNLSPLQQLIPKPKLVSTPDNPFKPPPPVYLREMPLLNVVDLTKRSANQERLRQGDLNLEAQLVVDPQLNRTDLEIVEYELNIKVLKKYRAEIKKEMITPRSSVSSVRSGGAPLTGGIG